MTQAQIEQIVLLRQCGVSYVKIAALLRLRRDDVMALCQAEGAAPVTHLASYPQCKECGRRIIYDKTTKPRLFCNSKCKAAWWNRSRNTPKRKTNETRKCPSCGKKFTVYQKSPQKYCCHGCYLKGRYAGPSR